MSAADAELSRRRLVLALAAAATLGACATPRGRPKRLVPAASRLSPLPYRLGIASYSLRQFDRTGAIAAIRRIGARIVNIKSFHLPYDASPGDLSRGRQEFETAGLEIVGGGTVTLAHDDDDDIRGYFDYARAAGLPLMVIAPRPGNLARIEKFVREYDIRVAIHNHGPEDPYFAAPADALALIRDLDPRIGVCLDTGHTARTGTDIVEAAREAGDRLLDLHLKDLSDPLVKESQCVVGDGALPIAALLRQLRDMRYSGAVNLEYEIDADDPVPGMMRSFAYMRGVTDALSA